MNWTHVGFRSLGRIGIGPILLLAFVVRLVPLIVHHSILSLPQGTADAVGFERKAWSMSSGDRGAVIDHLGNGGDFLAYLGSFLYDVVGRQPAAFGLGMLVLGVALVFVVYRIVFEITEDAAAGRVAGLVVAVFPQLVLHSVLFLREIPVAFFLAVGLWGVARFLKHNSLPGLAVFILAVAVATLFHTGAVIALPGVLLGVLFSTSRLERRAFSRYAVKTAGALALLGAIVVMDQTGYGLGKFGGSFDSAVDAFESGELRATVGGAAYPEWMRIRGDFASEGWKIPIRFAAFLFSPLLPFLVRGVSHLLGALDAALYLLMFGIMVRNWRTIVGNKVLLTLLVMGLTLAFVYALGVSNFGTAIRHRAKIVPIFIVLSVSAVAASAVKAEKGAGVRQLHNWIKASGPSRGPSPRPGGVTR